MSLADKLNGKYFLETAEPKDAIVDILKERIDEANKNSSWFSFPDIDYRKIKIDPYRMVVKRNSTTFQPYGGSGVIIVHFYETADKKTLINAEIKPFRIGLWIVVGFIVVFSAFILWISPFANAFFLLAIAWVVFVGLTTVSIILFRYTSKGYLQSIFRDIGINELLEKS